MSLVSSGSSDDGVESNPNMATSPADDRVAGPSRSLSSSSRNSSMTSVISRKGKERSIETNVLEQGASSFSRSLRTRAKDHDGEAHPSLVDHEHGSGGESEEDEEEDDDEPYVSVSISRTISDIDVQGTQVQSFEGSNTRDPCQRYCVDH